jgi:hypothetical protein
MRTGVIDLAGVFSYQHTRKASYADTLMPRTLADELLAAKVTVAVCSTSNEKAVQKIVNMMGPEKSAKIRIFAGDCVKVS